MSVGVLDCVDSRARKGRRSIPRHKHRDACVPREERQDFHSLLLLLLCPNPLLAVPHRGQGHLEGVAIEPHPQQQLL